MIQNRKYIDNNSKVEVKLKEDDLLINLYWTVNKFREDQDHKQQNSSRDDLIGGFFDRWINRIPEYLIFNELLSEQYSPVVDNFIYTEKSSKNAPDIIGLKDNNTGKYFPFAKFYNNRWEMLPDAPFIEMKVFRESQNLITIPSTQFIPDRYYAIVESHVPDDYLISVFSAKFFDKLNLEVIHNSEIKKVFVDGKLGLFDPKLIKKPSDLGGFKLLGIYKGSELYKLGNCTKVDDSENDDVDSESDDKKNIIKPRYLKNVPSRFIYESSDKLCFGTFNKYYYMTKSIPVIIEIRENSFVNIINSNELSITINVDGQVLINNEEYDSGDYNLFFELIYRNGIRYYSLTNIQKEKKTVVLEKELKLFSGLLFHYGSKQIMVEVLFNKVNDNDLTLMLCTSDYLLFNAENVEIDNQYYTGFYKFEIVAHGTEKSRDNIFYRKLKSGSEGSISGSRKYNRFFLKIPSGNNDFDNATIDNPKLDLSDIKFDVLSLKSEIIEKNSLNSFILAVNGEVRINGKNYSRGFYKICIGKSGNNYFIKQCVPLEGKSNHPKYNADATNILKYSKKKINDFTYIIDLSQESRVEGKIKRDIYIPFSVELLGKEAEIKVHEKNKSKMIVSIDGKAKIDNFKIDSDTKDIVSDNFWNLTFEPFDRSSKKEEFILSKRSLYLAESCEKELLDIFERYMDGFK